MAPRPTFAPNRRSLVAGLTAAAAASLARAQPAALAVAPPWTAEGFVPRAGGRIHWAALRGDAVGEPVVLLHKLGGWIADWRACAPLIAPRGRVIALDLPGHGESTMLGPPPYAFTVPESAAMVRAALDELGVGRCAVVGASLGGCVGVVMAALWPERVSRLALISVSLAAAMTRAELAAGDAAVRSEYGPNGEPLPRTAAQTQRFASEDPRVNAEANASRAKAGVWVRPSERGVGLAGVADYLPRIEAPTLLVYADRGPYGRYEAVGRAKLRHVEVATVAGAGSFVNQEKPEATAAALNRFLA